jgi:hypothetical protein
MPAAHFSALAIEFSGMSGWSRCGKIEKSTTPSVMSSPVMDGFDSTKSSPTRGVITMLPALSPIQMVSSSDGNSSARPGLPHPVTQIRGVAAVHQQGVHITNPSDPALSTDAGQRGEFQHAQGLPPQLGHGTSWFTAADEPPCSIRTDSRVPISRRGNAQGAGVGDRFAQEVDQRLLDARILDACGR